ncbi:MAG: hypothetical protein MUF40_01820 [Gemmatimonadaceae bacterium]|jgi:hypothetical protein|nr:hypothetical protein [Gemmatimonadaceae bacterium]
MTHTDFEPLLAASAATPAFRADLAAFAAGGNAERIEARAHNPRVKILRTVAQLLAAEPTLAVDRVVIAAVSGCSDYAGTLVATDATGTEHRFAFTWDCAWKARQAGYTDHFGLPDQIRAAREFGWDCFAQWAKAPVGAAV